MKKDIKGQTFLPGTAPWERDPGDVTRPVKGQVGRPLSERQRRVLAYVTQFGTTTWKDIVEPLGLTGRTALHGLWLAQVATRKSSSELDVDYEYEPKEIS